MTREEMTKMCGLGDGQGKPYLSIKWLKMNILRISGNASYCPTCFANDWRNDDKTLSPTCQNCGWVGSYMDCLDVYEAMNMKRTKLIDQMLDDNM